MNKLILFEMEKIWKKKSFLLFLVSILIINIFLLWYTNLPGEYEPSLGSYKKFERDISKMSEKEKQRYVETLYQDIQGVALVEEVRNLQSQSGEMMQAIANQKMAENPGMFEKYYDAYQKGDYLKYTESLEQEETMIQEIYEEFVKVSGYKEYLDEVQESRNKLSGISIFANSESEDNFSSRNIEKSAKDYQKLSDVKINYFPSKGIVSALENHVTDVLFILSVFLFLGSLIYEEKEKRLFYITRETVAGRGKSIGAKLAVLALNCMLMAVLMYGVNLIFFERTTGLGDMARSIQSVAPYMESNLTISVMEYFILTIFTKAAVLFGLGTMIVFAAIVYKQSFGAYLTGIIIIAAGALMYYLIPAYSIFNPLKYLNIIGLMKTENIYGAYLNFDFFGCPISRFVVSWIVILVYMMLGVTLSATAFVQCRNMELEKIKIPAVFRLKPHNNLLRHEGYKILVTNRGFVLLLIFSLLIGYQHLSNQHHPSSLENYYQSIMMKLEGRLTTEKIKLIETEQARYEAAFDKIAEIEQMVDAGEIDGSTGDSMKASYYGVVSFYPAFQRVLAQYEFVRETDGAFVYDTGYLYLFGVLDNGSLMDFLLLSLGIVIAFGNVMSMEAQRKSWYLLSTTAAGKKKIVRTKKIVCIISAVILSFVPWICRYLEFEKSYPMNYPLTSLLTISAYRETGLNIPIAGWIFIQMFVQALTVTVITWIVLLLSRELKSYLQVLFAGSLLLVVPLVLQIMGFEFAWWISFLPVYTLVGFP